MATAQCPAMGLESGPSLFQRPENMVMYPTKVAVQRGAQLLAVWGRKAFVTVLNWVTFASSLSADVQKIGPIHGFSFDHTHPDLE